MERMENTMDFFENVEGISPTIYYHYTSLEALYSIIDTKTFRMTNLKSSNDRKELTYCANDFLADFRKMCEKEQKGDIKDFFELMIKICIDDEAKFNSLCKNKYTPYALCLSNRKDSLTHWERYASNGTGVCIGFNVNAIEVLINRLRLFGFFSPITIDETLYTNERVEQYIKNAMINFFSLYKTHYKNLPEEINRDTIAKNAFVTMAAIYQKVMKFVKNSAFIDEGEVRVYHGTETVKDNFYLIKQLKQVGEKELYDELEKNFKRLLLQLDINDEHFMVTKSGIRSYKNLCLENVWGSGTIPEIILGPMCVQNKNDLRRFLKSNGLDKTKISVSKVPIR